MGKANTLNNYFSHGQYTEQQTELLFTRKQLNNIQQFDQYEGNTLDNLLL